MTTFKYRGRDVDVDVVGPNYRASLRVALQLAGADPREIAVVLADDLVLVERMPDHLRGSHRASGNWGRYPDNGAERAIMSASDAEELLRAEYDHIVRDV